MNKTNNNNELLAGTCLLLSISKSDGTIEQSEIEIIKDIIRDFFNCDLSLLDETISIGIKELNESTDIYEFSKILNNSFTYQDKIDFISCTFEVAFADGEIHYLEDHFIKKIANILNVEHSDLINSKKYIQKYLQ